MSEFLFSIHNYHFQAYRLRRRQVQLRLGAACLSLFLSGLVVMGGLHAVPVYSQTTTAPTGDPTPIDTTAPVTVPVEEAPAPLSRSERNDQLLALAAADEVEWLDTPQGKILALFRPTANRMTKGAMLLLHAAELPPGWPAPLENLRRNLPEHGWVTLAITLPPQYSVVTPKRDPPTVAGNSSATQPAPTEPSEPVPPGEPAAEPDAKEAISEISPVITVPRAELIAQRIDAAIEFLRKNNQLTVTLLIDNSSVYDSLQHLVPAPAQGGGSGPLQALVLVNLQPQELLNKEQLAAIFSAPGLPVMDVFLTPDSDQQIHTRKRHRAEALRNKLENYQQFVLPPVLNSTVDNARSFWLERVRGFIEHHASVSEAKNTTLEK